MERKVVKKNPTVLFFDPQDNELYRIEQFQETEHILDLIERLNKQTLQLTRHPFARRALQQSKI